MPSGIKLKKIMKLNNIMKSFFKILLFILIVNITFISLAQAQTETLKIEDIFINEEMKLLFKQLEENPQDKNYQRLIKLIKKEKNNYRQSILYFGVGFEALERKKFKLARKLFSEGLTKSNILNEYGKFGLARSLYFSGKTDEAYQLIKDYPQTQDKLSQDIFWLKIDSLIKLEDYLLAHSKLKSYLYFVKIKLKQSRSTHKIEYKKQKEKTLYYLGLIEKKINPEDHNLKNWKLILEEYPVNSYEEKILAQTNDREKKFLYEDLNWEKRAENLIETGHPLKAKYIYEFLKKNDQNKSYKEEIAQSLFSAKEYPKSAKMYEDLIQQTPKGKVHQEYLSKLASSYARSDQFEKAIKTQKKILKLYPASKDGRKANQRIRFLTFDSRNYKESKKLYTEALKGKSSRYNKIKNHWYRFWSKYFLKEYKSSLIDLNSIIKLEKRLDRQIKYLYWQARVLEKIQNYDTAIKKYQKIIQSDLSGYYYWQSIDRLNILNQLHSVDLNLPQPIDYILEGNNGNNLLHKRKFKTNHSWIKSLALSEINQVKYSQNLSKKSKPLYSILETEEIFLAYHLTHDYTSLSLWGREEIQKSDETPALFYWQASYPLAYQYWVNESASQLNMDKYLIWSIMRQESVFNPTILSPANAVGLMQIIPSTGYDISEKLNFKNFHPDMLLKPKMNIYFGSWYLNKKLKDFNYNLPFAIASYNAGPDAVNRWKKWGEHLEQDEFIDLIPYTETRKYVQKVLSNYRSYTYIYEKNK